MAENSDYCISCRKHTVNTHESIDSATDKRGVNYTARRSICGECKGRKFRRLVTVRPDTTVEPESMPELPEPMDVCVFCHEKTMNVDDRIVVVIDKNGREFHARRSKCSQCGKNKFRRLPKPSVESDSSSASPSDLTISSPSELLEQFKNLTV